MCSVLGAGVQHCHTVELGSHCSVTLFSHCLSTVMLHVQFRFDASVWTCGFEFDASACRTLVVVY